MVGCKHQAKHPKLKTSEALHVNGRPYFAAVQFRSDIFSYEKARGNRHAPTPKGTFDAVMETVSEWQRKHTLRLPELSSCESELDVLNSAESNPKRRRTTTYCSISIKKKE